MADPVTLKNKSILHEDPPTLAIREVVVKIRSCNML